MFSTPLKFAFNLKSNRIQRILRQCKEYSADPKSSETFSASEPPKITPTDDQEKLQDSLEFRNVGNFKTKRQPPNHKYRLISINSVFHDVKSFSVTKTLQNVKVKYQRKDQEYNPERVLNLGPDLGAAHFIVCRGGAVKFVGENRFIRSEINQSHMVLPNEKDPNYKLEAIDASAVNLVYEGISNLADLKFLSWISFKDCVNLDNWSLDHLSSVAPTIEYLDISGCTNIDHFGLSCLYRFKKLKCVNVEGIADSDEFKFACLTYEAEFPDLVFIGLNLKPSAKSVFDD